MSFWELTPLDSLMVLAMAWRLLTLTSAEV
jgi:hypothetical protein